MRDGPNPLPRIITPIPPELLARIEDYRFAERLPSRVAAIRQLIEIGLNTKERRNAST